MIDKKSLEEAVKPFMYKHPVKGHDMKQGIAILTVVALVLGLPIAASIGSVKNGAGPGTALDADKVYIPEDDVLQTTSVNPKIVDGTVRDLVGSPVAGALVTAKMMNGATVTGTQTYTTVADGFYTVTFAPAEWEVGYTISVSVSLGADTGSNSAVADAEPFQTVDVTLQAVIPEFSSLTVVGGSFIVVALAVVLFSRRRDEK